ncbi:hypothetical protein HII36_17495 [Nonomuraea sp. NN258]|uniref:hypothetical protein n=1 Tax=Nonomuraea antri TaxID=2730852 RepID=UPI001569D20F|nr:hypothetical protein [Nonomuraea antri]NRQ33631.1 hypothetical protein [Nonomuraea antri]
MRQRHLSRRAMLVGGAAALTACGGTPEPPPPPAKDSAEVVLLKSLIAEKERTIALYAAVMADGGERLAPFKAHHEAHLAELRKYVPQAASAAPTPATPAASATSSTAPKPSLARLRDAERKAAAARPKQLAAASPGLAQLIASIGACEAGHALALPRSL